MIDTVYIEEDVCSHFRTLEILQRFPKARQIVIRQYGQVFNAHRQNFRLQKNNPSLVIARKRNRLVMPAPVEYETGGGAAYYFSHMLNCLYDCRYCFLQGMFQSANYIVFVNFEEFAEEIATLAKHHQGDDKPAWFYSGYDCDSLAFEPITGFADYFFQQFESLPNAILELRTKSTQIRALMKRSVLNNVVVAYSLNPQEITQALEYGAPDYAKRLLALNKLQSKGWRIGVRFDPIIWSADFESLYRQAIIQLFEMIDAERIDSVTLGGFRVPKPFFKKMRKLHPEQPIFHLGLEQKNGLVAYNADRERQMLGFVKGLLQDKVSADRVFAYPTEG